MWRVLSVIVFASVLIAVSGCGVRGKSEAGVGEWLRLGECEVQVESVKVGKVKGKGMMGPGESTTDVFQVRTQFRNVDSSAEVKHGPWQSDSSMMMIGVSLTDDKGTRYQTVHFGMF